ncbi:MAG: response regulator [Acidobacteria bacterium]|nr:response regulator [Acidobacteriota bacterium]
MVLVRKNEEPVSKTVFVVDDEPDIRELVTLHLDKAGYLTGGFEDSAGFFSALKEKLPDLVLLDLMLPGEDGYDVCRRLKTDGRFARIPVIMLTARGEEIDKVLGLELGADDYVTKPFSVRELLARVKAVLRRSSEEGQLNRVHIGSRITIDEKKHEVLRDGQKIDLTSTEFRILQFLASKEGWVFTRDQILDHLWGSEKAVIDRTVDVHIKHLRQKLGDASGLIQNIRGVGYKLDE